jgi:hypothetical protein
MMVEATEINWVAFQRRPSEAVRERVAGLDSRDDWHRPQTAADLIIADLADGEAEAFARVAELAAEIEVLREMLSVALQQLSLSEGHLQSARAAVVSLREAERLRLCRACRRTAA